MFLDDSADIHICGARETIAESNEGKQVHTYLRKNAKVTARHNVYKPIFTRCIVTQCHADSRAAPITLQTLVIKNNQWRGCARILTTRNLVAKQTSSLRQRANMRRKAV